MSIGDGTLPAALPLDDYLVGAAFATDLVNTAAGQRAGDTLTEVRALRALLERHGVAASEATPADLRDVRSLRDRLLEVFAVRDGREAVAALNVLLEEPGYALRLEDARPARDWVWAATFRADASLTIRLQVLTALSLLTVVKTLGADRFRACAAGDCSGVFVDTSRSGRRRYCQPSICGNRHNVAAYRQRARRRATGTAARHP